MQEDYLKIGLRRLGIAEEYKGEKLTPLNKVFIRENTCEYNQLRIF